MKSVLVFLRMKVMVKIEGYVERVVYRNEDNGYTVLTVTDKGDEVTVVFPEEKSGWDVEANCLIKKDSINPCKYPCFDFGRI
mgnify:CR=1 FL=1